MILNRPSEANRFDGGIAAQCFLKAFQRISAVIIIHLILILISWLFLSGRFGLFGKFEACLWILSVILNSVYFIRELRQFKSRS